jgi:hypothetical protein
MKACGFGGGQVMKDKGENEEGDRLAAASLFTFTRELSSSGHH